MTPPSRMGGLTERLVPWRAAAEPGGGNRRRKAEGVPFPIPEMVAEGRVKGKYRLPP